MAKVSTTLSIDADVKAKVQALYAELGLDMSTAVNLFFRQCVYENGIPFQIRREAPNADTLAAMQEAAEMAKDPAAYKRYSSFSDLLREVAADA
jgi:DNA-damage-inducible protein J